MAELLKLTLNLAFSAQRHDVEYEADEGISPKFFSSKSHLAEPSYRRLSACVSTILFHDLRVCDETPSISRRELISISVEVLGSYSIYLFYLGGRGTVRDNNNNRNPSCWGSLPPSCPGGFL